jgi:proliferating cell nuclear antigen
MDIDNEHLGIPDQKYACIVDMPSSEFQKVCRDISTFSDAMEITATKSGIVFSGSGDAVTNKIFYSKEHNLEEEDEAVIIAFLNIP